MTASSDSAIKAVIFDFGGVLMRTGDPAGRREWETRLGLPSGELERIVHGSEAWIRAQRGDLSVDDYWRAVAAQLNLDESQLPALQRDYFRDDRLDPSLITLIGSLRARGLRVGLLSNDATSLEDKLRQDLHIYHEFHAVVISAQIGVMKPEPAAYRAILTALTVEPAASVFIDDNPANVEGAARLGIHAIHYVAGMNLTAALDDILKEHTA